MFTVVSLASNVFVFVKYKVKSFLTSVFYQRSVCKDMLLSLIIDDVCWFFFLFLAFLHLNHVHILQLLC